MAKNTCNTYFYMVGNFDPKEISKKLNLFPFKTITIGEKLSNGKIAKEAKWFYGLNEDYNLYSEFQLEKTIEILSLKVKELGILKQKYHLDYYLVVEPTLYVKEMTPALAPGKKVIDFCYKTNTLLEYELYLESGD